MRIIGGKNKGKKIDLPTDEKTRPLRDLVKESIFNLILHSNKFTCVLANSRILDLFSGTGSFGLECYSRGAKHVTFVENYFSVLKILKKNVASISANNSTKIIEKDCFQYFDTQQSLTNEYDFIFLDPPYKERKVNLLIDKIKESQILKKNGIIILHRHKKDEIEISESLNILEARNYGISKVIIGN